MATASNSNQIPQNDNPLPIQEWDKATDEAIQALFAWKARLIIWQESHLGPSLAEKERIYRAAIDVAIEATVFAGDIRKAMEEG